MMPYYVYVLAQKKNGVLYVGITSDLVKRVWEHKNHKGSSFTQKYNVHTLVYYEIYDDVAEAIKREKILKRWNKVWKIELIEKDNPDWKDLYEEIIAI